MADCTWYRTQHELVCARHLVVSDIPQHVSSSFADEHHRCCCGAHRAIDTVLCRMTALWQHSSVHMTLLVKAINLTMSLSGSCRHQIHRFTLRGLSVQGLPMPTSTRCHTLPEMQAANRQLVASPPMTPNQRLNIRSNRSGMRTRRM